MCVPAKPLTKPGRNSASFPLPATVQGNLPVQAPDVRLPGAHDPASIGHSDCIWKRRDYVRSSPKLLHCLEPARACDQWPHLPCASANRSCTSPFLLGTPRLPSLPDAEQRKEPRKEERALTPSQGQGRAPPTLSAEQHGVQHPFCRALVNVAPHWEAGE